MGSPKMAFLGDRYQVVWLAGITALVGTAVAFAFRPDSAGSIRFVAEIGGSRRAWIYAAFLYALAHVPTLWLLSDTRAGLNPLVVLGALGCGLVWGGLARHKGRLVPGALSHILFDWCVIMMFRFWGPSV